MSGRARIGAGGDYYTSPNAHPAFAALLALQIEQMWHLLGSPAPFSVVELGGGKGLLAEDLLAYAQHLAPRFRDSLDYVLIEVAGLAPRPEGVRAVQAADGEVSLSGITGCLLSNEFFDALPVHRVVQSAGRLHEIYVTLGEQGSLVEEMGEPSTPELAAYLEREVVILPEGAQAEISLEAPRWVDRIARALDRGYVITVDYGDVASRLFTSQRPRGTLMCYYRHTATEDPYQHIGEQDITAHVDFTALMKAGEGSGLHTLGGVPQGQLLYNLGLPVFIEGTARLRLPQAEAYANMLAMRDLAQPEGLGAFRVLVQGKDVPDMPLDGLAEAQGAHPGWTRLAQLPVPRLDQRHVPLLRARYPHLAWDLA